MKRFSIQLRVTLWFTVLMVALAATGLVFLFYMGGQSALAATKGRMTDMAEASWSDIRIKSGAAEIDEDLEYFREGVYLSVYDAAGLPLYGAVPRRFDNSVVFADSSLREVTDSGGKWYVYDACRTTDGISIWVRTVAAVDEVDSTITTLLRLAVIIFPFYILLAAAGGYLLTRRALLPVRQITQTAREIGRGNDLSRRIALGPGRDDVHVLADEFDRMFGRLEAAFDSEKQFVSDASHELRTPTAVILSQCEDALEEDRSPAETRAALRSIQKQAEKMAGMLSQLLMLARADSGRQVLHKEPFDMSSLAEAVAEEQQELAAARGITVRADIAPGILVCGDETMLMRMLINLMENGIKYGRENGHLNLTLTAGEDTVTGTVADDGIGIAREDLDKIWRRFWQADPSHSGKGAGLGLSMVKWIVEAHGGTITVESFPGRGSTFTFTLPRCSDNNTRKG